MVVVAVVFKVDDDDDCVDVLDEPNGIRLVPLLDSWVGGGMRRDDTGLPSVCMPVGCVRITFI